MTAVIDDANKNREKDISGLPCYHAAFYVNVALLAICVVVSAGSSRMIAIM
jgi:hypothetical protein